MQIVLFDNAARNNLFPLTATKALADLRCGIVTIKERWALQTGLPVFVQTTAYLQPLYKAIPTDESIYVDAAVFADDTLMNQILALQTNESIEDEHGWIAYRGEVDKANKAYKVDNVKRLTRCWQLFQWNDEVLRKDFALITKGRVSQPISSTNYIVKPEDIFIEEGARVECAALNASTGPIYIGKNAEVLEGAVIRGPFALCENGLVKMGAKIYGATTVGVKAMAGGEIKNAIINNYSNKAHDGYLGDSVIGEWCNLGAGTTNSNVKNTAGIVKMLNAATDNFEEAGLKAGVIMGDYSRTAINSSINTGTVIGVAANVFGELLLPKVIDSFSWGLNHQYEFEKAMRDINNWKQFKHKQLTDVERNILKYIFDDLH
ncbi:MAG: glucose-1-phosphate thymidylyltransferase [Chitinophaga sp.]|jgi:UDP-N-acetylglucosamine diphosphorylase / glucose-1-phosphate thymidylyltransferase / UDP-N-acetylgalactosamine diphosphorylase / glucosamine-1-phosphate N-acetyltransferase / galactosamine-1-phosphate N-acetyltransferase|nr:glucose-1-phosphate thymidylyltransferase [Chitinophaga sp.]